MLKYKIKLNYTFRTPDIRDYQLSIPTNKSSTTNNSFSIYTLQSKIKTVLDQGQLGSCVSNAFAQYINMCTNNNVRISRLCHYYCGRAIGGDSSLIDSGLNITQAAKIISKYGACSETNWPYIISNFNQLPSLSAFRSSLYFRRYSYSFLSQNINSIKTTLNTLKLPILFGICVYSSFMTNVVANTGIVPMPNTSEETLQGGHCILMVGYNDTTQVCICVNSWGIGWGQRGFFTIPYAYVLNPALASDFCVLQFVY